MRTHVIIANKMEVYRDNPSTSRKNDPSPPTMVKSLAKGLAVIESFSRERPAMTLSEVARSTKMTRASARRLLLTLVALGYAKQDAKHFSLTPKVLNLGYAYLSSLNLWDIALPIMEGLVGEVHESCSAAVLDGFDIVYAARIASPQRLMSIQIHVGTRLPVHATSMGRVLISQFEDDAMVRFIDAMPIKKLTSHTVTCKIKLRQLIVQVREQGWSLVDQELEYGLRSIAVPLYDPHGKIMAGLNVSTHASAMPVDAILKEILPPVQDCAVEITQALAARRI